MNPAQDPAAAAVPGRFSAVTWAVLGLVVVLFYFRFRADVGGTDIFLRAGDCMLQGEPLGACSLGFAYPPLFALFMVPFSVLPTWAGNLAWYAVLVATTYGSFRICETLTVTAFGVTQKELVWMRLFTVVLTLKFVVSVFGNQAYDVLVLFFLLVGLYGLSENRTWLGAFGLAAAAALKATPLLMLLYPLLHRKWKLVALGAALCAAFSFLPDVLLPPNDRNAGYLRTWSVEIASGALFGTRPAEEYAMFQQGAIFFNQSLKAFVYRLLEPGNLPWKDVPASTQVILYAVYSVYCLAALAIVLRSKQREGAHLWGASVVVISMLMLSPISSKSHFIVLLLPHMVIVGYLLKHRELWAATLPPLCASFVLIMLASRWPAGRELSVKMMSLGIITIATLLLLAVMAVIVFRRRREPQPLPA
ncbi:MAG: glycosyltransferase 87 family protein [Burkholderiales bacterium]